MSPEQDEAGSRSITGIGRGRAGQALYAPTEAEQRTARIMGAWFLGTFVFSIPAFWFYDPVLNDANLSAAATTLASPLELCLRSCWRSPA
jgi:hypothetical protein